MHSIFITGTAGSGKSLLTSVLKSWYNDKGMTAIVVNLDPGAFSLPYSPEIDVREHIDIQSVMESYQLGPNGALIFASDMIATRLVEIQEQVDMLNPEYVIFDTPGQIELFAFRQSGPFFIDNFICDTKTNIFLFDSTLVSSASNFVSIALLASSVQMRVKIPQIAVLSKRDIYDPQWKTIMEWSEDYSILETAIAEDKSGSDYVFNSNIIRNFIFSDFAHELVPVSSTTQDGLMELSATLSRIQRRGEETDG